MKIYGIHWDHKKKRSRVARAATRIPQTNFHAQMYINVHKYEDSLGFSRKKVSGLPVSTKISSADFRKIPSADFRKIPSADFLVSSSIVLWRGGGLGSRPKKMYRERLGDGVEYHFMKTTPRR